MLLRLFLSLFVAISYVLADETKSCILPPYPEHGTYEANQPNAEPGQAFEIILLNVTCGPGYGIIGQNSVVCVSGLWSNDLPKCGRVCQLNQHPSVTYKCIDKNAQVTRKCLENEPDGTEVTPQCNAPNYYSSASLPHMKCIDGSWDYVAVCQAECGRVAPLGQQLVLKRSIPVRRGQMPWHAGIYSKKTKPYQQICGGSLISSKIVITGAHCFWSDVDHLQPASQYAVAVGKEFRGWNDPRDDSAQKSDVKEIKIPPHFLGSTTNFQDDIALVFVSTEFEYNLHTRPVCFDFEVNFDQWQLETGRVGKVPTWDYTEKGKQLQIVDVNPIDTPSCFTKVPASFREYITSDKFCGNILNGNTINRGNGGAGLAVPETDRGNVRYYLRGLVSTAPIIEGETNFTLVAFTHILKHEHFIKSHLNV